MRNCGQKSVYRKRQRLRKSVYKRGQRLRKSIKNKEYKRRILRTADQG